MIYKIMTHYKLRVTLLECTYTEVDTLISKSSSIYGIVEEKGKQEENPHIHAYLVLDIKEDTFRTRLRKLTRSMRGNQLYSLKELQVSEEEPYAIEYLAYMMKEGTPTWVEIPSEVLEEAKQYDTNVKEEIKEKKEKKKSRYQRLTEGFELYCKEEDLSLPSENVQLDYIIKFFRGERCQVSLSTLQTWLLTLKIQYSDPHTLSKIKRRVLEGLEPRD